MNPEEQRQQNTGALTAMLQAISGRTDAVAQLQDKRYPLANITPVQGEMYLYERSTKNWNLIT